MKRKIKVKNIKLSDIADMYGIDVFVRIINNFKETAAEINMLLLESFLNRDMYLERA